MPTPIAHALMGATVVAAFPLRRKTFDWPLWFVGGLLGATPDLDCLFKFIPFAPFAGRGWHHDFTHSLGFALLCGGLLASLLRLGWRWEPSHLRAAFVLSAAMASHPLLDFMFTDSAGVELFWPVSHEWVRLGMPPPVSYDWDFQSLPEMAFAVVRIALQECAIFGSVFGLAWLWRQLQLRHTAQI